MTSTPFTPRAARWVRTGLGCCLLLVISLTAAHSQFKEEKKKEEKKEVKKEADFYSPDRAKEKAPAMIAKLPVEPGAVEVAFTDGSNLKLLLRDDKLALATPHGKLLIAVTDIQRIEFATRLSEEDDKRIRAAVADLGDTEFRKRQAASVALLKLREKAYPALLRAVGQKDAEVVRRAQELIQRITASVPAERLVSRKNDVVYTADSMITGRIEAVSLKAHTSQFGAVQVKLSDARSLRSQALEPAPTPATSANSSYPPFDTRTAVPAMPAAPPPGAAPPPAVPAPR